MQLRTDTGGLVQGRLSVPGDKSISHRAVMLGSIAHGTTEISGCLMGEDVLATMAAFRAMGVPIETARDGRVVIDGRGPAALGSPAAPLDLGNSGTSIRLLAGLLAGIGIACEMTGDASLCRRPMRRVTDPLRSMGARIDTADDGTPPLRLGAQTRLNGIDYTLPMASAQVKSAVLLAGLHATGSTCVRERTPSRDHTERMLGTFGIAVESDAGRVCVTGGQALTGTGIIVPGDISSAAFFLVGAAMTPGAELTVTNIGVNPTRTGVIEILRLMGADIRIGNERTAGAEPVADVHVRGGQLTGIEVPSRLIPSAIDEFPALFIAAAAASGRTTLGGAEELRHKESDRIDAMAAGLETLGVASTTRADGIVITGTGSGFRGGAIDSRGDHRIAMAFAIAGLRAAGPITIRDCAAINTSFPGFVDVARDAGLRLAVT